MASLGELLSGALGGEYSMGRPLDEEERRLIEELRAQGAYVPQERKVSPFRYGAGTVRQQNLADVRGAIQPEQERKMKELMWQREQANRLARAKEANQLQNRAAASQQRGAINRASSPQAIAERERMKLEEFNRQQGFADQLIERNKARRIADEQTRQRLGGLPTTTPSERFAQGAGGSMPFRSVEDYVASNPTPQITDQQKAELAVLQRNITPALTQAEALKQLKQKTEVGKIDVDTKKRAEDLAKQVHANLPSNYAQMVANDQVLGLELKTLLDTHRLNVSRRVGEDLMNAEADALIATKKQEIMAIEALEIWLTETAPGLEFMREGGPQREEQRLKLGQLKAMLMSARASRLGAEKRPWPWEANNQFPDWFNNSNNNNNSNTGSGDTGATVNLNEMYP